MLAMDPEMADVLDPSLPPSIDVNGMSGILDKLATLILVV